MKDKYKSLLFLLFFAMGFTENPAHGCSVLMPTATETYIMLVSSILVTAAFLYVPVALWLWRIKKFKARYTIVPSLLVPILALAIGTYVLNHAPNPSAAIQACTDMQREGTEFLLH